MTAISARTIIGRDRERTQLQHLLEEVIAGDGRQVLLSGEAGIGKTTLVRDLTAAATARGCLVLSGGSYDLTITPPFGPWIEVLRGYPTNADLPAVPEPLREGAGLEGIHSQAALFELASRFFQQVAHARPLLLVLEDLHWADLGSLELLRYLGRNLASHHILILATYRDDEVTRRHPLFQLIPALVREAGAARVELHGWTEGDIRSFIVDRYGVVGRDLDRLASYLLERASGNPLFVVELLHTLESEAVIEPVAGAWTVGDLSGVPVPTFVVQLFEGRLQALDDEVRRLLEIAAVIGQDVSLAVWKRVSGAGDDELSAALDRAIEAGIFEEAPGGLGVHFRHALIREALYGEIGILQRRDWHRATADVLIAMPQPDPDDVITHLDPAGDERLADWLVRSGDRAMSRFAWDTAVERFAEASRLLEQQDISDPLRMCQVLLKLGDAQNKAGAGRGQTQGAGNDPQALQTFWKVAGIARRAGLPEQLAEAALGIAGVNTQASHGGPEGFSLMHEALAMLPEQDSALRARLLVRLATGAAFHAAVVGMIDIASAEQVDEWSNSAVAMSRRLGDPETLAYTLQCRGVVIIGCPYSAERRANTEEFLRLAVQINDLTLEARARYDRVTDLSLAGDLDAARDEFTRYERVVERLHMPVFEWFADVHRAGEHLSAGRYVETKRGIDKIEATWPNSVAVRAQRVALYRETGDLNGMREATVSVESAPLALALRLQCLPECGELDAVREQFEAFIDSGYLFEELPKRSLGWWRIVAIAAETCAALDDAWRAGKIYEHLRPFDGLNNFAGYSQYSMGAVAHHLGLLAATIRDWNVAERHFSRALEQNDHWGYRPAASYTRFEWAAMLHRREQRGDRERARALLGQALATANELGMVRLKRLATVLARKVGILDQAHPAGLSSRELEVLELVAEGLTNAEIGAALYISPRTVAQHLRSVYNKLGVNSRAAAVGRWADLRNT